MREGHTFLTTGQAIKDFGLGAICQVVITGRPNGDAKLRYVLNLQTKEEEQADRYRVTVFSE